jgi:metal-responsive CopG/Arc/MetJ family transcriptional regulator
MERIDLHLDEELKKDWENFVDEQPGNPSLSQIIRVGTADYIARKRGETGVQPQGSSVDIQPLLDRLNDIEESIRVMNRSIIDEDTIAAVIEDAYWSQRYIEKDNEFVTGNEYEPNNGGDDASN